MEEIKVFKCKTCGEPLNLNDAKDGVIECRYCATVYTLPKKETSPEALAFLRMGEHNLDTSNWDGAISAYKKACEKDSAEPEAYWGLALANYKVQYVKDVVNNRLQPICHEISTRKFTESKDYQKALTLATPTQKAEYEKKATEIDYIKEEFYKLKQSGLDFDSFICVKVTDDNGGKTEDYKDAEYIYDLLKGKGYSPFFSERSIRNRTGADYEAMILYALYSAETMLVVCRNEEYLQTPWVKNEYTRFLRLVNDEEKESDAITFVYYETPVERLPGRQGKLQGIDFSRRGADNQIIDFVEKHTPEARARREELKRKKAEEELKKQEETKAQAQRIKELEEQLNKLNTASNSGLGSLSMEQMFAQFKEMERKQAEEAKRKAEEEARKQAEEEARQKAEEEARKKAEEARKQAEEAKRKAEEEAKKQAEEEARKKAEEQAKKEAELARKKAEEEARKKAEEEARKMADFEIKNGVLVKYKGAGGNVVIPDGVKRIEYNAFYCCASLTSVTIPDSVTIIGMQAFRGCRDLTSVTIGNSVTSIGAEAFESCGGLKSITLPDSIKRIGSSAFSECWRLIEVKNLSSLNITAGSNKYGEVGYNAKRVYKEGKSFLSTDENGYVIYDDGKDKILVGYTGKETDLSLPSGITHIYKMAFEYRGRLTSITIPDSVESIGDDAFSRCWNLTSIIIPNSVKSIGAGAFYSCGRLTSITIPDCVTSVGNYAFAGCSSLKSITIPDSVSSIGNFAFSGCSSLTSIKIPNGVESIGESMFSGCKSLTNITLPKSVSSIGKNAFLGCDNLTEESKKQIAQVEARQKTVEEGKKTEEAPEKAEQAPKQAETVSPKINSKPKEEEKIQPQSTDDFEIENGVLKKYKGKGGDVVIPDGVTSIGEKAFYMCKSITSITIPNSVISIGKDAFFWCGRLIEVKNLSSLNIISGSRGYGEVGLYAKRVYREGKSFLSTDKDGYVIYDDGKDKILVCYTGTETDLTLPSGITQINQKTFLTCNTLTSINTPNSVTSIGDYAFCGCTSLTTITIPDSVTSIKSNTFQACKSLKNITIPKSVKSIGECAFKECRSLTSITIPDGVTCIGLFAFDTCSSLTSIIIPNSVKSISFGVFEYCGNLKTVTMPKALKDSRRVMFDKEILGLFSGCKFIYT